MISNYILIAISLYKKEKKLFESLSRGLMIWTLNIYVWCLILSVFNALGFAQICILYILSDLYMAVNMAVRKELFIASQFGKEMKMHLHDQIEEICSDKVDILLNLFIIGFVICLGFVASISVPYNYDSIDYHAPRICQWVQNRSVFYYASHVTRQNFSTVLASYVATFAYILTGQRTGAMCVIQFGSYVINLGLILYLCRYFNVRRRIRELVAILWITLPIGFAEAITPQNDHCATTWLLLFLIELISLIDYIQDKIILKNDNKDIHIRIVIIAVYISLGYLTKPAVCFAMLFFLLWYLVVCIKDRIPLSELLKQCLMAGGLILFLICPQMIQNYLFTGTISADIVGKKQLIGTLKPKYLFINMSKNLIYNIVIKVGRYTNEGLIKQFMSNLSSLLEVDVNHPDISEGGLGFGYPSLPCYTCDAALNFTVYILTALSILFYIILSVKRKNKDNIKPFIICSYISFVLLCAFLRWEKSVTRYMIGYFALFIVVIAIVMDLLLSKSEGVIGYKRVLGYAATVIISLMIITDIYYEVGNLIRLHPVFPVRSTMTMYHGQLHEYTEVCELINGMNVTELGIIEDECPSEYALWQMLDDDIIIRHVNIRQNNPFIGLEDRDIIADVILSKIDKTDLIESHGCQYHRVMYNDCWSVYIPDRME